MHIVEEPVYVYRVLYKGREVANYICVSYVMCISLLQRILNLILPCIVWSHHSANIFPDYTCAWKIRSGSQDPLV
jgi:hypothetical protein